MTLTNPYRERIKRLKAAGDLSFWGANAIEVITNEMEYDVAHDEAHIVRVLRNTLWFGEGGDINVMVPAAVLHDLVNVPKDSPNRAKASRMSAEKAIFELEKMTPFKTKAHEQAIFHAIEAHSWSAGIEPMTLEAKALQDADRIDALGNIGIARLFATGGSLGRALFHPTDPMAVDRPVDELKYTLDHFYVKLNKLSGTMQTTRGREAAEHLTAKMRFFITDLLEEL